jgi:hypothetical protein
MFSVTEGTYAYPRANYLNNGNIIGSYTAFPPGSGNQLLTVTTSTDGGVTWTKTGSAAQRPVAQSSLDNPYPFQRTDGKVLLAYRNHDKNDKGVYTTYRITISLSDNLGADWWFLSDAVVVPAGKDQNGLWEPFLRTASDGTLQLYYSHENNANDQDNVMRVSKDLGKTWGDEIPVSGQEVTNTRDGMVGVVETANGALIAVFESVDKDRPFSFRLFSVSSSDGGKTWGNRKMIYDAGEGKSAGAPQIVQVGGLLVVSFMTDEDRTQDQNNQAWDSVATAKFITSNDGGSTWGNKTTVFAEPSSWPSLLAVKNENAVLYLGSDAGVLKSQKVTF